MLSNSFRISVFRKPQSDANDSEIGGKVVDVKLGNRDSEIDDTQWRMIASLLWLQCSVSILCCHCAPKRMAREAKEEELLRDHCRH
ncbi:Nuclear pore complex protein NUP85 [Camellia lanceoleosa]|uniref:Nuclear pore complex protein NUP85 n=1 Tax=Camellia lanceoleosa TaxID=1840588 RepID=A0ACC0GLB2_9ERIC|nr:Nuclear pore complex protein NUP85 [Camellia lanceoleosa]